MAPNSDKRRAALIDDRRTRVASYKVRGFSIRQTIAALAVDGCLNPETNKPWTLPVISGDIQAIRAHWQAEAQKDIGEWVKHELQAIDEVERQAWAAWNRSVGTSRVTVSERKDGKNKASVRTEDLAGDARFLTIVLDCQQRRAHLLGLDSPTRIEAKMSGPGVMVVPLASSVAEWEAAADVAQQTLKNEVKN